MPDEHEHRVDEGPVTESTDPTGGTQSPRTSESLAGVTTEGDDPPGDPERSSTPAGRRLITAVEIQNFKGIGRPMRVDLRPITLLFGNNSAGKSTVLHALCYAHESLSHRRVDAHKPELGGDRIDLGGFPNFVHAHDSTCTVRLRFELNLEGWEVPDVLRDTLVAQYFLYDFELSPDDVALEAKSGWVELRIALSSERPILASYEVGVNEAFVGRLHAREQADVVLEFDPSHPLLEQVKRNPQPPLRTGHTAIEDGPGRAGAAAQAARRPNQVREASGPEADDWQLSQVPVLGLASALPYWGHPLVLDHSEQQVGYDITEVDALVSTLLVGIGHALHDELASLRYIGPIRDLHPQARADDRLPDTAAWAMASAMKTVGLSTPGSQMPDPATWANGAAAWTLLRRSPHHNFVGNVSDWLGSENRLDTGYALRAQSFVTIDESTTQLASTLREYHQLRGAFGNAQGSVDLDRWAHKQAKDIVATVEHPLRVTMQVCSEIRARFAGAIGSDYFDEEVQDAAQGIELVDRYLQHLHEAGSVETTEARLRLADNMENPATTQWVRQVNRDLARIVARMDAREKHRDKLRKHKKEDDRCRDRLRKLKEEDNKIRDELAEVERQLGVTGTGGAARDEAWQKQKDLLEKLRASLQESRSENEDIRKNVTELRTNIKEMLGLCGDGGNVDKIERQISVPRMDNLHLRVDRARAEYRRLTELVAKMEQHDFTRAEVNELAAAMAAGQPQREPQLVTTKTGLPVRPSDVGVGISQILPIVVAALDPDRPGLTAIEQPELHLHPRVQVELGDLFTEQVAKGGIFLIETHSEHLLLRFMRRMRQTSERSLDDGVPELRPEGIAVYFVEIDPNGEQTLIREMPLNERGELVEAWPGGFFEEDLREIF